ncbi:MAG: hypothetical protein ACK4MX_02160, partial [Thermaurantiacus sp.]
MILDLAIAAVMLGLLVVLVAGLLAPFESLGWWAGWSGPDDMRAGAPSRFRESFDPAAVQPDARVVVLFGINDASETLRHTHEEQFVADLAAALPGCRVIADLFPYSAFGVPLNGDRVLARFWAAVATPSGRLTGLLNLMINLRNFLQVLTSADHRYGPFYNFGLAQVIVDAMLRDGYDPARPRPLVLVGYSGGGQLAIAASGMVHETLGVPVHVVSIGGFLASVPGIDGVARLTHIHGSRDSLQALGRIVFPERWPAMPHSHWNRAEREGRIRMVAMEGVQHAGPGGYFGREAHMPDGRTHMATTVDLTAKAVRAAISQPEP